MAGEGDRKFDEQCFFMDNLDFFLKAGQLPTQNLAYKNFVKSKISADEDSSAFYNQVTIPKGTEKFLNITPAQAAALVPRIKLYKVTYPDATSEGTSYELIFKNYLTQESLSAITSDRMGRGAGAGIKSFSWENKGESQATANKRFESKLELYFQDFDALNRKQTARSPDGSKTADISFLDLIVPSSTKLSNKVWNKDYFRMKISVGWEIPNKKTLASGVSFSSKDKDAIESSGKVFFLNLVSHELNFNPDGQINLSISYIGSTETILDDPDADILALPEINSNPALVSVKKARENLRKLQDQRNLISSKACAGNYNKGTKAAATNKSTADIDKAKEVLKEAIAAADTERYERFINYLYFPGPSGTLNIPIPGLGNQTGRSRMMYIDVSKEVLEEYRKRQEDSSLAPAAKPVLTTPDTGRLEATLGALEADRLLGLVKAAAAGNTNPLSTATGPAAAKDGALRLVYTTFGNIIEAAFFSINKDEGRREIRTMLGMVTIPDLRTGASHVVNIADIPVSYKMFSTWFYNVCISKNMKEWRLKKFLQSAAQTLFRSVLKAKCFENTAAPLANVNLKIETLDLPQLSNGSDPIIRTTETVVAFNLEGDVQIDAIPDPTEHYKSDNVATNSYLLIYGEQTRPNKFHYQGAQDRQSEDEKKKVFHFRMGQDRGLVKNINFSRTDIPFAKEARLVASENQDSKILKIREVYDVNITLYGNTIWSPGSLIYVDISSQFGNDINLATRMGLQAYYRVIGTSSFLEGGKYEVTLKAKYEFSGEPNIDNQKDSVTIVSCPPPVTPPKPASTTGGRQVIQRAGGRTGGGSGGIRN